MSVHCITVISPLESGYINAVAFGTEKYTCNFQHQMPQIYQNIYKTSHNEVILPSKDPPTAATYLSGKLCSRIQGGVQLSVCSSMWKK